MKTNLYFKDEDAVMCEPIEGIINDARIDGLTEITVFEADEDFGNLDYIWCTQHGEVVERRECKKSYCSYYKSKSGRGVCSNRGKLYTHGEKVTFKINQPTK